MSEEEKVHLPGDVADEFFTKKEEMKKEKEERDRKAAEKRASISATLEKHIETKTEKDPSEE